MNFIFYIFTLFASCYTTCSYETKFPLRNNLWKQIIPLMRTTEPSLTSSPQQVLRICTAEAIFLDGDKPDPLEAETLQTLKSLHLFSNIVPMLAKTNLHWGYFELSKKLCQITDDLETVKKRNFLTLYLQSHTSLLQEINQHLKSLKPAESNFLLLFYFKQLKKEKKQPSGALEEGFAVLETTEKTLLSNRYIGGIYKLGKQINCLWGICASLGTLYAFNSFHQNNIYDLQKWFSARAGNSAGTNIASSWPVSIPYTTLCTIGTMIGIAMTASSLKEEFDEASTKQKNLLLFKNLIKTTQQIMDIVENNPIVKEALPEYLTIKKFADWKKHSESISSKMYYLLDLLDYYPFNQEPNDYPLWQGKIHEAFILYEELKSEIVPLWQALGSLDACISVQNTLADQPDLFCVPQWSDNDTPLLDIKDYWHPMIAPEKVVKNEICLGTNNVARNTIITGANAGGKTTAMTAMMLCAIFAQSIGIVPAKSYNATPFARMHTYLDITTNLQENESLFVAQANRAKSLYTSIKNCQPKEKTLTILDEIFTGTRADFAEQASFEFAQKLGNIPHSIAIIATHFPKLTELEQSGQFINYQAAPASMNPDGTLSYPYLIIPGVSTQNIADIILHQKGLI